MLDENLEDNNSSPTNLSIKSNIITFLNNRNYDSAIKLINDNITQFCHNIETLQDYSLRIGAKSDNKEKTQKM